MRATSTSSASCVMGPPERNWSNSFNAMAVALRISGRDRRTLRQTHSSLRSSCKRVLLGIKDFLMFLCSPEQNAVIGRFCHPPAQTLASGVVSAEVLPCVNTAQSRFLRRGGEAGEVSRHFRQRLGADIESELVAEVKAQHGRGRFTDCAVCSGVGR